MANEITAPVTIGENNIVNNIVLSPIEINAPVQIGEDGVVLSVSNTGEILLSLVGGDLSASLVTGGIDILKLDSSVQLSLGKADSALQSGDNISVLTNDSGYITGVDWGEITGTLSNQTDLQNALNLKYDAADYNADFGTQFSSKTTTDLTEGTNLYYTDARAITALNPHTSDTTIHFTEGSIDHANIQNIGTNTHAQIDTFIGTTVPGTYVPYTGATTDVDLGANDLIVDTDTLFVDASTDNVGIGTAIPDSALTVEADSTSAFNVRNTSGQNLIEADTTNGKFVVRKPGGIEGKDEIRFSYIYGNRVKIHNGRSSQQDSFVFTDDSSKLFVINARGDVRTERDDVSLGTSNFAWNGVFADNTLDVALSSDTEAAIFKGNSTQTANLTEWQDSAGNVLSTVDSNGNVGIGTTSPSGTLGFGAHDTAGDVVFDINENFRLVRYMDNTVKNIGDYVFQASNNNGFSGQDIFRIYYSGVEFKRLTIPDILIGFNGVNNSTPPGIEFSNHGDGSAEHEFRLESEERIFKIKGDHTNSTPSWPDTFFAIDNATGNVGIGTTSPQNKLDISGAQVIGSSYAGVETAPTDGLLVEGNVGIGTDSPDTKLHNAGAYTQEPLSTDPSDPDAGNSVQWVSDGTGTGDAGDVMMKINVGGTVKTITLVDYSTV